ncbi:MAG: hypothetical protein A2Z21_01120 [Candidatus Fraserbacteria bacterium RBG_16_55_9]|uniref:NAD kinase n=1 Tax=Fraserbacteria sp. (strain RBG_16_55_9) TaxID=1817864 RepID=A0A1F5UQ47_FRAXR|nr:MAG: hypothetical protein A2Z21_01120 [Candidatus Fraserbacteria bacterium RBG_16_55_9]
MFPKKIIAVFHPHKPEVPQAVEALKRWAEAHHIGSWAIPLTEPLPVEPDEEFLAISLGGDGTFLKTAKLVAQYKTPILGINVGSLGFLTQTHSQELIPALDQVFAGEFTLEERLRLEAEYNGQRVSTLNEIVLARTDIHDFTRVDLYWDEEFISRYPGDGVIIATPSGSTAYSLAAHGPIVFPALECMLITPLNVHALGLRPLILPAQAELRAAVHFPCWLIADGIRAAELQSGSRVLIRRSAWSTRAVVLQDHPGFFDLMANKLGWGSSPPRP